MWKRKGKRKRFIHHDFECKRLTDSEIKEYSDQIISHNKGEIILSKEKLKENIDCLIKNYINIVVSIVGKYQADNPNLRDDMLSEALLRLVELLTDLKNNDNLGAYISITIHGCVSNVLLYGSSKATLESDMEDEIEVSINEEQTDDILEIINNIIDRKDESDSKKKLKKKIIELKLDGKTETEIALEIGCSQPYINNIKQEIWTILKREYLND